MPTLSRQAFVLDMGFQEATLAPCTTFKITILTTLVLIPEIDDLSITRGLAGELTQTSPTLHTCSTSIGLLHSALTLLQGCVSESTSIPQPASKYSRSTTATPTAHLTISSLLQL
ncbi:N-acetylglucosaminyltransferase [Fusarium oxysporum f. sp. albedinis]|nr:N-acetylglucosaminyltransferase [Fusarium oxysporum f. sp. albedinis]